MKSILSKVLKAQSEIGKIKKDGKNPHYRSAYATLPNVLSEVLPVLQSNNLLLTNHSNEGILEVKITCVETGESISTTVPMLGVTTMQLAGQAYTYGQRYGLLSLLGLCPDIDDDGEGLEGRGGYAKSQDVKYLSDDAVAIIKSKIKLLLDSGKLKGGIDYLTERSSWSAFVDNKDTKIFADSLEQRIKELGL